MLTHFHYFSTPVSEIQLPKKFTFPFYYEPHALCRIAAQEVQDYLKVQTDFEHNFGLGYSKAGIIIGKMFGVLVVQNQQGEVGYLAAVSGRLADKNTHKHFVPPVYDILAKDSYYLKEKSGLEDIESDLERLEQSVEFNTLMAELEGQEKKAALDIQEKKEAMNASKKQRKLKREEAKTELTPKEYAALQVALAKESLEAKYFFNNVNRYWEHTLKPIREKALTFTNKILQLKEKRKSKSVALQQYISEQYHFLNAKGEVKNVLELFSGTSVQNIPAGTGECAAPKLLQFAFLHDLKPVAMAEFWWGQSHNKEVRKHQSFYPACQGKCKPILTHMLDGLDMDTNPLLQNPAIGKELETVFEDEDLVIINKPAEFLSVPGIHIQDSVYTRIKQEIKNITGPIIVHRLDMSTSGLLVLAKNKKAHKHLQSQFINRTVKKRYTALLEGTVSGDTGAIDLPLRLDIDDRPRQLVCYEHGKTATTNWEVVERKGGRTKIHFFPVTGRTHQLRVHAAHSLGLKMPIVGDDLYGQRADRLHLHADTLEFTHPTREEKMTFFKAADF